MVRNIRCSAADVVFPADKLILCRMSSEECNELRSDRMDMKGMVQIGLRFFITLLFSFIPCRRFSIGDRWWPIQKQLQLIDRRSSRLSAAVTISCLTRENNVLISFLDASWSLSGSQVI